MRILGVLSSILFSRDKTFEVQTPLILQTLLRHMFSLFLHLSTSSDSQPQAESLRAYIGAIRNGQCGTPVQKSIEKEYGSSFSSDDSDARLLKLMIAESLVGFMEAASPDWRRWALHELIEVCSMLKPNSLILKYVQEYWPLPDPSNTLTPLMNCVHFRILRIFLGLASPLLASSSGESETFLADSDLVIRLLRSRLIPEVEAMDLTSATELRVGVIKVVTEVLRNRTSLERDFISMNLARWYQEGGPWAESINVSLTELVG